MSKGRQGEIKRKQTELLRLTAAKNGEEMKRKENSIGSQIRFPIKLKQQLDTVRHRLVGNIQTADTFCLHILYSLCF